MVLTVVGYLLLVLTILAMCLFCWLSYACLIRAARPPKQPAEDNLLERAAGDITPPVSAGSR